MKRERYEGDGYSKTSLIRHSMGPENNVGLGGCWIMECLLPYLCMVTVPHIMVRLERMLDYRGVRLARFHCRRKEMRGETLIQNITVCIGNVVWSLSYKILSLYMC